MICNTKFGHSKDTLFVPLVVIIQRLTSGLPLVSIAVDADLDCIEREGIATINGFTESSRLMSVGESSFGGNSAKRAPTRNALAVGHFVTEVGRNGSYRYALSRSIRNVHRITHNGGSFCLRYRECGICTTLVIRIRHRHHSPRGHLH